MVAVGGGGVEPKYEPDELSRLGVVGGATLLRDTGDDEELLVWLDDCVCALLGFRPRIILPIE
jgi:hypothetical protein